MPELTEFREDLFPLAGPRELRKAREVWKANRSHTDSLIGGKRGLHILAKDERQFLRAMKEAFAFHYLGSQSFQRLCAQAKFFPWSLKRQQDLFKIPYFFVSALKYHSVRSVPSEDIVLTLRSSGTTGQTSAITLDRTSLRRITRIVKHIYGDLGMADRKKTNYLCFTYDPAVAKDVGTAFSDKLLTGLTGVAEVHYAIEWDESKGDWNLNVDKVAEALERFQASGRPFRVLGFPAHTWKVLSQITELRGQAFRFGPSSYVITGGGWKNFDGEKIPQARFRQEIGRMLGLPPRNVRDLYGMVEHGVPYCECEHHRFHVPRYSRVAARDPVSLRLLPPGEIGLLHLLTPYHNSFPAVSLLTTDLGAVTEGCPCGRKSPVLHLVGRGGLTKHKGCAMAALKVEA